MDEVEFNKLLDKAQKKYSQNFLQETCFERAIFFSWDCAIKDCGFCYMSAHTKKINKPARRTTESILSETILCKKLGWQIGFLSGGIKSHTQPELKDLLEKIYLTYREKIWLNAGPITKERMQEFLPYIKGVVGSIETINPELHKKICPSKPIQPYEQMFENAQKLGLQNAMTIIIGMGETINDFGLLKKFVQKYNITKISIYGLLPHKRTMFENSKSPSAEHQAEWIAKTRITFPKIKIQCGIWSNRTDRIPLLLKAGANTITKFPAISRFGTIFAKQLEQQAQKARRTFKGTLTKLPQINIQQEITQLPFDKDLKEKIKTKLQQYINKMTKCKQ